MKSTRYSLLAAGMALAAPSVFAHSGGTHVHSLFEGMAHPLTGWDHLLAMLAVGVWSAQQGGKRLWALPAAFVAMMAAGGALGMAGYGGGWVETGIALSVAVFGLLIALAARLPVAVGMLACGAAALAHGMAHGAELPAAGGAAGYAAGFLLATATLHLVGIAVGKLGLRQPWLSRAFGVAAAAAGGYLLLAA